MWVYRSIYLSVSLYIYLSISLNLYIHIYTRDIYIYIYNIIYVRYMEHTHTCTYIYINICKYKSDIKERCDWAQISTPKIMGVIARCCIWSNLWGALNAIHGSFYVFFVLVGVQVHIAAAVAIATYIHGGVYLVSVDYIYTNHPPG